MLHLQKFFEFKESDLEPVSSFRLQDTLNPKIWSGFEINEDIKDNLLKIATDFWESIELKAKIKDVILTGSLANFNYSKYSDFDLHIIIDFKEINDDIELVKKLMDSIKTNWNKEHDIVLRGYDVETYIQDMSEKHTSSGVYSLMKDKWVVKPSQSKYKPDEKSIEEKGKSIMLLVDDLEKSVGKEDYKSFKVNIKKVWEKVKKLRKDGLESKEKEFSTGNLVFKLLRRNGYIEKILTLKRESYDKQFEGFSDWFKDSEKDKIGKDILKKLDDIDPEDIQFNKNYGHLTMIAPIGKNTIKVIRMTHYITFSAHNYYDITINDTELLCSKSLKEKICNKLIDMHNEEKNRQSMQKISTDLNL